VLHPGQHIVIRLPVTTAGCWMTSGGHSVQFTFWVRFKFLFWTHLSTFALSGLARRGGECCRALCGNEEVVVVPSGGMLQRAHDARSVVVWALDVEGLAVASEADHARPGPWS
jgi:hypothetical protein